jgi:hypothetical protein
MGGPALIGLVAAITAGCGGSDSTDPTLTSRLPTLAEGAYEVSVSGDSLATGLAFQAADGRHWLLLSTDGEAAATVAYIGTSAGARRVPLGDGRTISFDLQAAASLAPLTPATWAGRYDAWIAGQPASFTVGADGSITAGTTPCRLSGRLGVGGPVGGAPSATLDVTGCIGIASGSYNALAWAADSIRPAAIRMVGENGQTVIDLLAYR